MNRITGVVCWLFSVFRAEAQYPANFVQNPVATGLTHPTSLAFAPDGRIFVTEQGGTLRVIKNGALLGTPFLSLTVNSKDERGLLGVAFDPNFASNQYLYVYYTHPTLHNRVSRFTANGDVVVAGSELPLMILDTLIAQNHNGGALAFGPDGTLYVSAGENANGSNAQNVNNYLGKILRINTDGSVPAGNPFAGPNEANKRIWAYGLRNPYTISFQPGSGRLFINDVGQSTWEEIDDATTGGGNYGWPAAEGFSSNPNYVNPVYVYKHGTADSLGCAITGGTFFSPSSTNYPSVYYGKYFFMEYCGQWINYIDPASGKRTTFATGLPSQPLGLKVGNDGNLYFLGYAGGGVYKVVYNAVTAPFIIQQPAGGTIDEGESITLDVRAIGSAPLTYQWKFEGNDIAGAGAESLELLQATPAQTGHYQATVSNPGGTATSDEVLVTVKADSVVTGIGSAQEVARVFPNPVVSNAFTFVVAANRDQVISLSILDGVSRTIAADYPLSAGNNTLVIQAGLSDGMHYFTTVVDGRRMSGKFIVLRK